MLKQQIAIEKEMEAFFPANPIVGDMTAPRKPYFQNRLIGKDATSTTGTSISVREDEKFVYYDVNLNDPKNAGVQTKIENGYLTVSASDMEKRNANGGVEEVQSMFEQTLPLPRNVDAKAVQTIAENQKIVLKFPKVAMDQEKEKKTSSSVPFLAEPAA